MQSLIIHIILLALLAVFPNSTESLRFWQIRSPIEIKVQKNSPPYQAFKLLHEASAANLDKSTTAKSVEKLSTETANTLPIQVHQKIVLLEPVVVKKFHGVTIHPDKPQPADTSWLSSLPLRQRERLEEAQARFSILNQPAEDVPVEIVQTGAGYNIKGPIEISGGLALTNEHFIELRRHIEGSAREAGKVSVKDGIYNIHVDSLMGTLIARMYNKDGRVLGEGNLRLAGDILNKGTAPTLVVRPQAPWGGTAYNTYSSPNKPSTPEGAHVTAFQDETNFEKKDGSFQMPGVSRDSATVVRASAENFLTTNSVQIAQSDFKAPLFPQSMMKALKEIVSEQMSYDLNDPELPVVWGQVLLNGKPMPGAQVEIEGYEGIKTFYFDGLNLPDSQLAETSANGYFAIIGAPEGFHALIAKRGGAYFAHNVVMVEVGTVSLTQLESTLKTKNVPLRVFDAFTGAAQPADIEMQSLETPLSVGQEGWTTLLLPEISRYSLMQVVPTSPYVPAQYFYQDSQEYIHLPLIQEEWLSNILQPKWDRIDGQKGVVVGFFQYETFEVYLAGDENFPQDNITFFDAYGNRVNQGQPGGGFIVTNLEVGTHEVVVFGKESEKIYSRIIPADPKSVSVLTFDQN